MIDHRSIGDPCEKCGSPAARHRSPRHRPSPPEHQPEGDPCTRITKYDTACGLAAALHRPRSKSALDASRHRALERAADGKPRRRPRKVRLFVGVDGEGYTDPTTGRHLYCYIAAVDSDGNVIAEARNPKGLTFAQIVAVLLAIPRGAKVFGYSLGYDLTKILESLPEYKLYELSRRETRRYRSCDECHHSWHEPFVTACPKCGKSPAREGYRSVYYDGYKLNWQPFSVEETLERISKDRAEEFFKKGVRHARFGTGRLIDVTVVRSKGKGKDKSLDVFVQVAFDKPRPVRPILASKLTNKDGERFVPPKRGRRTALWDSFKFYQSSFVKALESWNIGTPEERDRIQAMKDKRGGFSCIGPEEEAYCKDECRLLAMMTKVLVSSHDEIGVKLKRYDSPGSTATELLATHEVEKYAGPRIEGLQSALAETVMRAYFGGRFECSVIGKVHDTIWHRDIASAYPYTLTFLPCLKCGTWEHVEGKAKVRRAVKRATAAVCKYEVHELPKKQRHKLAWGPLPCRDKDGSIVFGTNFTGWAWMQELGPALRGWPELVELGDEAWVYTTRCKHRPFAWMPNRFRQRCEWGSSGKGLVMKNGTNSVYGKLAQSVGSHPRFQNWPWAGMVTAATRGQILDAIATLKPKDRWHIRSIATDGITTTKRLKLAAPKDTGTNDCVDSKGRSKVLGAWDDKKLEGGMMYLKPGMNLPLDPNETDDIRARGVGRKELGRERQAVFDAWDKWERTNFDEAVLKIKRRKFYGLKMSIGATYGCKACGDYWPGHPSQGCQNAKCKHFGTYGTNFSVRWVGRRPACSKDCAERGLRAVSRGQSPESCGKILSETHDGETNYYQCLAPVYGTWATATMDLRFEPLPKRERLVSKAGTYSRLHVRDLGGVMSIPYKVGVTTPQGIAAREGRDLTHDQPDQEDGVDIFKAVEEDGGHEQ